MKTTLTVIVLVAIAGSALLYTLARKRASAHEERAVLQTKISALESEQQATEQETRRRERELRIAHAQLAENAAQLALMTRAARAEAPPTNSPAAGAKPHEPLIKDPETRALMHKQQLERIRKQVDRFVDTNLMARLALTPEQNSFLRELVLMKHAPHAEFMAAMMSGELDGDAMRQTGRQLNEQLLAAEQEIQNFLGPERYQEFQNEEKAQESRLGVRLLDDELNKSGHAFTGEQREQLLASMIDERRNFPFADGFGDPMKIDFENFHDHFSDANLDRYLAGVQAFNESVRLRASAFLSPEQIDQIRAVQQRHLEQSKITVKLTNALFSQRRAN